MLDDIERVMPYDVRLTRIGPSVGPDGVLLTFEVVARNRDAMLDFIDNLVEDPRFDEPTLANEKTPEDSDTGTYLLSMRVRYLASEVAS
jgi:Tfp pilus assembly protein PilN